MSSNYHDRSYVEESRQFDIEYRAKDSFLGSDELSGSTLAFVLYQQKGAAKFGFRGIDLPLQTGNSLQITADEFKKSTAEHKTIVDESAKMFGQKGEEPKTITEVYYCYSLPAQ